MNLSPPQQRALSQARKGYVGGGTLTHAVEPRLDGGRVTFCGRIPSATFGPSLVDTPDCLSCIRSILHRTSLLESCEVCGAGPQGRCDPPDSYEGECPHGCSPER